MVRLTSALATVLAPVFLLYLNDVDAQNYNTRTTGKPTTGTSASQPRPNAGYTSRTSRMNVIVTMKERTDSVLSNIRGQKFTSRGQRIRAMQDGLQSHARTSQARVLDVLGRSTNAHSRSQSFWLTNQVHVSGATQELVAELTNHPDVESVVQEQIFPLVAPVMETASLPIGQTTAVTAQWGVTKIGAADVWLTGTTGIGVTVGIIDTGVLATHTAISANFRGDPKTFDYGWLDGEGVSKTPFDATGHGTHVTGIIAGSNGIGVAPGAKWMMCKGCRSTGCYASDLLKCFQFMLCPTKVDGTGQDCTKAPQVVNNSWGGGQGLTIFDTAIAAWRTAGIIPVVASGNTGPSCGTIQSPGDHPSVISVGATDALDAVTRFSAKGPTTKGLVKPDVMGPGQSIRSSCSTGIYDLCSKSGTSMAAPHVTGAVALYLSKKPGSTFDQVKNALQSKAKTVTTPTGYTCGKTLDSTKPNNQFGYGRIDISSMLK